jgi:tRNA threonylcarbamoyladenosine biosynthesis protein TsaE
LSGALVVETGSVDETRRIGAALGALLRPGDVVLLTGELGAGKTALVQGAAAALGVREPVTSPTFVLVRDYEGRVPVHHVDVYRLDHLQEVIDLGFEEMVDSGAVTFVEWGDDVLPLVPASHLRIEIATDPSTDARRIAVEGSGLWEARRDELAASLGVAG